MGRAASELEPLRHAADRALRGLLDQQRDEGPTAHPRPRVVVVAPGEPAEHDAAGEVSFSDFGRDVRVPALAGSSGPAPADLPTPVMVGRYLLSRVSACDAGAAATWADSRWLTVDEDGAPALAHALSADPDPVALVLLVDGAASHGPKAPRAEDSRAGAFDDAVADALAAGDTERLAATDLELARLLGADAAYLWPFLAAATTGATWQGDVLWRGEPYGVGWTVALWRRA